MAGVLLEEKTEEERAAHVRAIAEEKRAEAIRRAAELKQSVGPRKMARALAIEGMMLSDELMEPGPRHYTRKLAKGDHLRIIDLDGQQAVDFLCYDLANTEVKYNAANTIKLNRSIYIGKSFKLYSDTGEALMTLVEDTVGFHDTIAGCCSGEVNHLRYGIEGTPNCRDNFISGLAEHGLRPRDIPANVNFFMYVPVLPDGSTEIRDGLSQPGDFVDLRADKDVLVVISNCPQRYNPCSGWNPTPIRLIEWRPR